MNNQILILAPIGYRFTHVMGAEEIRLYNTHWVKVANEYDVYGKPTGNIVAVHMTNDSNIVLDDEIIDGTLIGVTYNGRY